MVLNNIRLRNFRNYKEREFAFDPCITVITGPNGSGKTNILEAVYVLATGKSFRDSDIHLAAHDTDWWLVEGEMSGHTREVRLQQGRKSYTLEGTRYQRRPKTFELPVLLFEPDHLQLIHGSPRSRRVFLDTIASRLFPEYASVLRQFERILLQRNKLLKHSPVDTDQLFIWDLQFAEAAEKMYATRQTILQWWNSSLSSHYSHIAGAPTDIGVEYQTSVHGDAYKQSLLRLLHAHQARDSMLGTTTVGPHRDDYSFYIDSSDFVTTASRGEIRSLLLSITYATYLQMSEQCGEHPLVLLDDVFSEFDSQRQTQLMSLFADTSMILTGTDNDVSAVSATAAHIDLGGS